MVFDIIHLDGAKETYRKDLINLIPLLANDSIIIFDDTQNPSVQKVVDDFVIEGYLHRTPDFPKMDKKYKWTNEILLFKK